MRTFRLIVDRTVFERQIFNISFEDDAPIPEDEDGWMGLYDAPGYNKGRSDLTWREDIMSGDMMTSDTEFVSADEEH